MNPAHSLQTLPNYLQLDEHLHTSGQPSPVQLEALGSQGIRTVINLALPTSDNAVEKEAAIITGQGIRYLQIPVNWETPLADDYALFASLFPLVNRSPLLIHCAKNMRVSAFIYLYRRVVGGLSHRSAAGSLQKIWTPTDQWFWFMNRVLEEAGLNEEDFT